jgi:hypothetical protein
MAALTAGPYAIDEMVLPQPGGLHAAEVGFEAPVTTKATQAELGAG